MEKKLRLKSSHGAQKKAIFVNSLWACYETYGYESC